MANVDIVEFNGVRFRRYPDSKNRSDAVYYRPSAGDIRRGIGYLHQEIWKAEHGEIPDGHHIHHKDGDPLNNAIENLECLPEFKHLSMHGKEGGGSPEHMAKIRPLAAAWHSSPAGREFAKKNSVAIWEKRKPEKRTCRECGAEYETRDVKRNGFCSNACKSRWRRAQKIDHEKRSCEVCGAEFECNKYETTKTCSRKCAVRIRYLPGGDRHGL